MATQGTTQTKRATPLPAYSYVLRAQPPGNEMFCAFFKVMHLYVVNNVSRGHRVHHAPRAPCYCDSTVRPKTISIHYFTSVSTYTYSYLPVLISHRRSVLALHFSIILLKNQQDTCQGYEQDLPIDDSHEEEGQPQDPHHHEPNQLQCCGEHHDDDQ